MSKRAIVATLGLVLAVGVGTALAGSHEGKTKTVEGTLVDSKCYLKGGMTTNDHMGMKGCGTACAKMGIPVALLTSEGKLYTLAVPAPQLAEHVGHTLRATGTVKSGALVPDRVEMKEGADWKEIKLATMM